VNKLNIEYVCLKTSNSTGKTPS